MQPQNPQIENLHQQASVHYLQGEFQEALRLWRELLALNPKDERAQEGIRLCELLAEQDGSAARVASSAADPPSSIPAAEPFDSTPEGLYDDLEEAGGILDPMDDGPDGTAPAAGGDPGGPDSAEPGFSFDFSDLEETTAQDLPLDGVADDVAGIPDPAPQAEGLDLGDSNTEALPLGDAPDDVRVESHSHATDLPAQSSGEDPDGGEAAASELRLRVNELLAEALTCYEEGRKEDALTVLNRVFILDDANDTAQALYENIHAEIDAERKTEEEDRDPDLDTGEPEVESLELQRQIPQPETPAVETDDPSAPPDTATEVGADAGPAPEAEVAGGASRATPPAAVARRRRSPGLSLKLLIVGAAVVLAGGGIAAFYFLGGSGTSDGDPDGPIAAGPASPFPSGGVPGNDGTADDSQVEAGDAVGRTGPDPSSDPSTRQRIDALVRDAREAMQRGDFSAAVMAYDQAARMDPDNLEVRAELTEAGERYQAEKALAEKRRQAIEAFNNGNYRKALTTFYRLPEGSDPGRLERYKRNGWFNLGLKALQAGDCAGARNHFQEARTIDPSDREALLALDLAKTCRYSRSNAAFRSEVSQFALRALDD